jgi:hypothetical protein
MNYENAKNWELHCSVGDDVFYVALTLDSLPEIFLRLDCSGSCTHYLMEYPSKHRG